MNDRKLLTEALSRTRLGLRARKLFLEHPELEATARRFTTYLTDRILEGPDVPLIDLCLGDACHAAEEAKAAGKDVSAAFCAGLMRRAHEAMRCTVCAVWEDGAEGWDPFLEPLSTFLERHKDRQIEFLPEPSRDLPEHVARLALASRIVPAWLLYDVVKEVVTAEMDARTAA